MAGLGMMSNSENPIQGGAQGLLGGMQYNQTQKANTLAQQQYKARLAMQQANLAIAQRTSNMQQAKHNATMKQNAAWQSQFSPAPQATPGPMAPRGPQMAGMTPNNMGGQPGNAPNMGAKPAGIPMPGGVGPVTMLGATGGQPQQPQPQATQISQMYPKASPVELQIAQSMGPTEGMKFLYKNQMERNKPTDRKMYKAADGYQYWSNAPTERVNPNVQLKAKDPLVVNNMGNQETEQSKSTGKALGSYYAENFISTQKRGSTSYAALPRLNRARQLLAGVDTGSLQPAAQTLKSIARDMGVNLEGIGIKDNVPLADNLRVVAGEFVMDVVSQTKGSVSDREMGMFEKMSFNLRNSPEGNMLILEMAEDLHKRNIEVAKIARNYRKENGGKLDDGLSEKLADYHDENPMFTENLLSRIESIETPEPAATKVINGQTYYQRGNMWFSK